MADAPESRTGGEPVPWMPPRSMLFRQNETVSVKEAYACLIDCFKYLFGEDRLANELNDCGLGDLAASTGTELELWQLRHVFEILHERAVAVCHPTLVRRSVRRLQYFLDNCSVTSVREEEYPIKVENDIAVVRNVTMKIAQSLGFSPTGKTSLATAVSELARNILHYANGGKVVITPLNDEGRKGVKISAIDSGPGIPDLDKVLSGAYRSRTGMGMGLLGVKRLLDDFKVETAPNQGTAITGIKYVR